MCYNLINGSQVSQPEHTQTKPILLFILPLKNFSDLLSPPIPPPLQSRWPLVVTISSEILFHYLLSQLQPNVTLFETDLTMLLPAPYTLKTFQGPEEGDLIPLPLPSSNLPPHWDSGQQLALASGMWSKMAHTCGVTQVLAMALWPLP